MQGNEKVLCPCVAVENPKLILIKMLNIYKESYISKSAGDIEGRD